MASVLITAVGFASNSSMARSIERAGDLRLVALDVDDDVDVGHPPGDLGHAIGAAGGRRGSVISTWPPNERTSSKISAWSAATQMPGRRAERRAAS